MRLRITSSLAVGSSLRFVLLLAGFNIASSLIATATVTNVVWYRLGESDPDAAAGIVATNTLSEVNSLNLRLTNGPRYSADVAPGSGSILSMQFSSNQWGTNAPLNFVNNFGLELWVKSTNLTGNSILAYNGHTGTNGWGLMRQGTNYQALFGGAAIFGTGLAISNVWTHLAVVRDNGTSTFYINGIAAGTNLASPAPLAVSFGLGGPPQGPTGDFLNGLLDEVRVFTFAPGQFSTNDLLLNLVHTTVVTNLADSGPGTLRTILAYAFDGDEITFATNGTITLTSGQLFIRRSLQIIGPGVTNLSVSGNNASSVFNIVSSNASVAINGLTIRNGRPTAGIYDGGGVYNSGTLAMNFCEIVSNAAAAGSNGGGGDPSTPGGSGGNGGGIFNTGVTLLYGCTFVGNVAGKGGHGGDGINRGFGVGSDPGAGGNGGKGGAIYNAGLLYVNECTFSANVAGAGGDGGRNDIFAGNGGKGGNGGSGGGIFNAGTVSAIAVTLFENGAGAKGGNGGSGSSDGAFGDVAGICNSNAATVTIINSIVAVNLSTNAPDLLGDFVSHGHNVIGQLGVATGFTNGINGDQMGSSAAPLDPLLAPLANNGGLTRTHRLLPTSPAIDSGDDALLLAPYVLNNDQRNFARKVGAHVDVGALESEIVFPPTAAVTVQVAPSQDPVFGTWNVTLQGTVNPGGLQTAVYFQFGISAAYGGIAPFGTLPVLNTNVNPVSATVTNLVDSRTYHYRVVASNSAGIFTGIDRTFSTAAIVPVPGDINGDGVVDTSEFQLVQSNYFANSPYLQMTNVAGLGGTNVTFALTNTPAAFNVEYTTNLTNWILLGPATPRFLFTDTNAPGSPQRYYRLRWP